MCDNKEALINEILTTLDEEAQGELMKIIQIVLEKYQPSIAATFTLTPMQEAAHAENLQRQQEQ
jgi:hypothetical protein